MAASVKISGSNREGTSNVIGATRNGMSVRQNSMAASMTPTLRHNTGISVEWSPEEQSLLEDLLSKYASDSNMDRYAKIAKQLGDKTVRDIAFRCRWMATKENGKRKQEEHIGARKNKDKKEKAIDMARSSSIVTNCSGCPPYAQSSRYMDNDDVISYKAIGGVNGQLLEQNVQALDQISANFASFKIHENISLFCQARDNILTIMNGLNDLPEIMKQMPPLPVKLDEELMNSILPLSYVLRT